jgi:hypothetical protein
MHVLTLLGLIIIAVVVLAAAGGWATSGATRLGREIGFLLGLLVGLGVALLVLPHVSGRIAALVVLLVATIGGGMVGAGLLGGVGNALARGLYRLNLGSLDRLLGALLSAVGAVALCAIVLHVVALVQPHGQLTRTAHQDAVAHWLLHDSVIELF